MNTPNNKRKKQSQEKIEKTFIDLLQTKEVKDISISQICKISKINRSTFYANYIDIYDLVEKIRDKMIIDFFKVYTDEVNSKQHSYNFLKLFEHIKNNQLFYKTYFKLNLDYNWDNNYLDDEMIKWYGNNDNLKYHVTFFKAGLNAIIQEWLKNNCQESPEEMVCIIKTEYTKRIEI